MNNNKRKMSSQRSQMTRQLLLRYFLSLFVFIAVFVLLTFLAFYISNLFIWYDTNIFYHILKLIKDKFLLVGGIICLVGFIIITYHFVSKTIGYLDEIVLASQNLAHPTDDTIVLPNIMKNVQDELNLLREQALRNTLVAKEAEQRKNDLIVYLAHDLKTPLTSVIGYLTLLRDESQISPELREKYLSISLDKAQRLEDLINEFFEITRFNLSNINLEKSSINLTRILEQLIYEFKPMLEDKNLKCILHSESDIMLKCDADKMQRVFDNLLRNAVNYSFENSEIEISVIKLNETLKIRFVNHGNTIPSQKLQRIFEQFYRLDSSRTSKTGGAGLGLAIAKEITELHHGTITAKSDNELIVFEVTFPLS